MLSKPAVAVATPASADLIAASAEATLVSDA